MGRCGINGLQCNLLTNLEVQLARKTLENEYLMRRLALYKSTYGVMPKIVASSLSFEIRDFLDTGPATNLDNE